MPDTNKILAYCWATGEVGFGCPAPEGTLIIGWVPPDQEPSFKAHCRMAYDNKTLLVPGLPECGDDQVRALDVLYKFQDRLRNLNILQ